MVPYLAVTYKATDPMPVKNIEYKALGLGRGEKLLFPLGFEQ